MRAVFTDGLTLVNKIHNLLPYESTIYMYIHSECIYIIQVQLVMIAMYTVGLHSQLKPEV